MADRQVALAARDQGCACRNRSRPRRWHPCACGPAQRQSPRPSTGRRRRSTHDLELRYQHGADSIPIARHRLRGRFSPTGSFAYRTRGDATSMVTACAPRPPGKRLSALCPGFAYAQSRSTSQRRCLSRGNAAVVIGRCWPCSGPKVKNRTNTPVQTVHADFPHTAYQWSVGSQHYAGLLLPGGFPG